RWPHRKYLRLMRKAVNAVQFPRVCSLVCDFVLDTRQEERCSRRAVGRLHLDQLFSPTIVEGKDIEARSVSVLCRHPADTPCQIAAVLGERSTALDIQTELLACLPKRPISEVSLHRIELPDKALQFPRP